ncbi:unnamed protein product, partial [Iphiclides podalirius]
MMSVKELTRPPVQCLALALVCDVARAGDAVGQMVTWRASSAASEIVYAILHMLSKDLAFKVSLADESYNLYKNIKLPPQDETILVLASHYLTLKLNETWTETKSRCPDFLPQDNETLQEFLHIGHGWSKEIKRIQEEVIEKSEKESCDDERSFYEFLSQVRLNVALDALREVRCNALSSDRFQITHSLLHDAVSAEKRRSELSERLQSSILKTYSPPLDSQNKVGQHVKVLSIEPKKKRN